MITSLFSGPARCLTPVARGQPAARDLSKNGVSRKEKIMHARVNMLAGDPDLLTDATRYLEGTVRPHVESQHGNRGLACLVNAELGTCVVASYWDSLDAMTASEHAVQVSRKE